MAPFNLEAVEASLCYFFENWWMKLKCPLLLKPLATIVQENSQSFYPSEPFRIIHARAVATASALTESELESTEVTPESSVPNEASTATSGPSVSNIIGINSARELALAAIDETHGASSSNLTFAAVSATSASSSTTPAMTSRAAALAPSRLDCFFGPTVTNPAATLSTRGHAAVPPLNDRSLSTTQELWSALGLQAAEGCEDAPTSPPPPPPPPTLGSYAGSNFTIGNVDQDPDIFDLSTIPDDPNHFVTGNMSSSEDEVGYFAYSNSTDANQFYTCYNCCPHDYTCMSELIVYSDSDSSTPPTPNIFSPYRGHYGHSPQSPQIPFELHRSSPCTHHFPFTHCVCPGSGINWASSESELDYHPNINGTPDFVRVGPGYPNDIRPEYTWCESGMLVRINEQRENEPSNGTLNTSDVSTNAAFAPFSPTSQMGVLGGTIPLSRLTQLGNETKSETYYLHCFFFFQICVGYYPGDPVEGDGQDDIEVLCGEERYQRAVCSDQDYASADTSVVSASADQLASNCSIPTAMNLPPPPPEIDAGLPAVGAWTVGEDRDQPPPVINPGFPAVGAWTVEAANDPEIDCGRVLENLVALAIERCESDLSWAGDLSQATVADAIAGTSQLYHILLRRFRYLEETHEVLIGILNAHAAAAVAELYKLDYG